jgi:hypothetical protein
VLKPILATTGRIEIAKVGAVDKRHLLHAMGREVANVHLGSLAARDLAAALAKLRTNRRFAKAVDVMAEWIVKELRVWRRWQRRQAA